VKKTSGILKKKNVESVFIPLEIDETSGVHESENEDEEQEEQPFSPIMNDGSSSSTPSSTPVKMRRLSDVYARCNFLCC